MFVGTALSVHLLVYAGLSLFIINGPYVYVVICVVYAYNLTLIREFTNIYVFRLKTSFHKHFYEKPTQNDVDNEGGFVIRFYA